jgi:hypothetical protein
MILMDCILPQTCTDLDLVLRGIRALRISTIYIYACTHILNQLKCFSLNYGFFKQTFPNLGIDTT